MPSPKKTEPGSRASFHKPWKPPRSITEYCDLGSVIRSPTVPSRPFMSAAAHSRAAYAVSVGGGGQRLGLQAGKYDHVWDPTKCYAKKN